VEWYDFATGFNNLKCVVMKGSRSQNNMQNKQMISHQPRPEIRDNLDSREGEEQQSKGDDTTHNRKEKKTGHLKNRGKDRSR
jgi:hypothetical protein